MIIIRRQWIMPRGERTHRGTDGCAKDFLLLRRGKTENNRRQSGEGNRNRKDRRGDLRELLRNTPSQLFVAKIIQMDVINIVKKSVKGPISFKPIVVLFHEKEIWSLLTLLPQDLVYVPHLLPHWSFVLVTVQQACNQNFERPRRPFDCQSTNCQNAIGN